MNQRKQILEFINENGSINPIEALEQIGCFRLATRVFELKQMGYPIKTRQHKYKNAKGQNKRYAVYYLESEDQ